MSVLADAELDVSFSARRTRRLNFEPPPTGSDAAARPVGPRAREVLRLAERALEARRADLHRVLAQVLAQHVRDPFAQRVVDAVRVVDVDGDPLRASASPPRAPRRRAGPADRRADLPLQLLSRAYVVSKSVSLDKRNGRAAPTSPNGEMWCGRIAKGLLFQDFAGPAQARAQKRRGPARVE